MFKDVGADVALWMALALYVTGCERREYPSRCDCIEFTHGRSDDVIPSENSM